MYYLITIPPKDNSEKPFQFVTDDISKITGKYDFFMIQKIDFV